MDQLPYYYLFLALLFPLLLLLKTFKPHKKQRLPPGPWQLPVIGSLHHLRGALPHHAMRDLSRRHGPLMLLRLGEVPTVVASSPSAAREIMKTHDAAFATRPRSPTTRILRRDGEGILFTPYGDYWRQVRKLCVNELLSARRVQAFRPIREAEVADLVASIAAAPSGLVNLSERLRALIADSAVRAVIGGRFRDRDVFLRRLDDSVRFVAGFSLFDLFPSSRLVRALSSRARTAERHRQAMFAIMDGIIREHKEGAAADAGSEEEDLVAVLLRIQRDGGLQFPLTTDTLKTVILDIFAAGSDTSATTLQWTMAELMRNPAVMKKAQSEVRRALQGHNNITEDILGDLKYMHLVIKETLRLHPPTPLLLPRQCQESRQILGYDVPKGATVLINAWALGRDAELWDNAEEFKPERFEHRPVDFKGADFQFIPFGAGRRICPGMSFGLANIELTLAALLFHFDWELPSGVGVREVDMAEAFGITARMKHDLWLQAIPHDPLCP